jgi:pimeloyl-ACP methyl ester carboxylesterase
MAPGWHRPESNPDERASYVGTVTARVAYDEFAYFHENAEEFGLPYDGPPTVRREQVELDDGRRMSALVWGDAEPELVLIHGGAQNAHTWDTVAMALDRPLLAVDLPGHGHSDAPRATDRDERIPALAADVAVAIRQLAPRAAAVVGMSLGGLTSIALTTVAPELVRKLVLVDITPGVTGAKAKAITDFVRGPATFASFDELLARTIEHNPTRTESSLRRGILHNAEQLEDGSWRWRYRRHDAPITEDEEPDEAAQAAASEQGWATLGAVEVPVMLVRGMRPQSVIDDGDEAELLRRLPTARVEHVDAGHSVQGDAPVELAALLADFVTD